MTTPDEPQREPEPVVDPQRAGNEGMRPERGEALADGEDFGEETGKKSLEELAGEDE